MGESSSGKCLWRTYRAYGLRICSEFELPELCETSSEDISHNNSVDVTIRLGQVPERLQSGSWAASYFQFSGTSGLILVEGIARILVQNCNLITVEILKGAPISDARGFILGSGLGLVLHQRNILPLHVSALETSIGAIAITGPSGAGKSTTAINLHYRSKWPIICDDVAVASSTDGKYELVSGINRIKIWKDAAEALGMDCDLLVRDIARANKFHFSEKALFANGQNNLRTIFVLKDAFSKPPKELFGAEKFAAIMNAIYRPEIARIYWDLAELASRCSDIAKSVSVIEICRDKNEVSAAKTADLLYKAITAA